MFLALLKTIADEMTLDEINEEIDRLIGHRRLVWLLGAGASFASGLPLMDGLTARVVDKLRADKHTIKDVAGVEINTADFVHDVLCTIGGSCTVEQVLDHLADYLGMARRVAAKTVRTPLGEIRYDPIERSRLAILHVIRETIRYGYRHDTDPTKQHIGSPGSPIVDVRHHVKFVEALFGEVLAARFAASPVDIFTTNYDTLIEDALSLCSVPYADGFSGGAVAFWNPSAYLAKEMIRSRVYKLHGS
ncbi:MAG TPA: SIR2 family protein, partial [Beijerinckiaceae bacterium]|nr:SIR2 family protein [Beijerinckiaceae bacterium]